MNTEQIIKMLDAIRYEWDADAHSYNTDSDYDRGYEDALNQAIFDLNNVITHISTRMN